MRSTTDGALLRSSAKSLCVNSVVALMMFSRSVDVFRDRYKAFSDPRGGLTRRWRERVAKCAGGAGEDKRANTRCRCLFEQCERARDVGVHKALAAVRGHVRLVQRGGMQHGIGSTHALGHQGAVGDGADRIGERRRQAIQADDGVARSLKCAHQRLAQVACASSDEVV